MKGLWLLFIGLFVAASSAARADPNLVVSAQGGDWVSVMADDEAGNRICMGMAAPHLAIRASPQMIEIRVTNSAWSMAADVTGDATFKIGSYSQTVPMAALSGDMLTGVIEPAALIPLLNAMDKAATLQIVVGKAKPMLVSLNGSTRVLNDFRTCSTVKGYGDLGGTAVAGGNPFQ